MKASHLWMGGAAAAAVMALGYAGLEGARLTAAQAADAVATSPKKVDNFRLAAADLQAYDLYRMGDAPAIVLVTQQNGCAAVRSNAAALKALQAKFAGQHVEMLMLNSSLKDNKDRDAILAEAKTLGLDMPILMDSNQLVGEQLGVTRANEAIVINPKTWTVAYRGPASDAAEAVDAIISGKPIKVAQKVAEGCAIDFPERAKVAQFTKISYSETIAPMIKEKCAQCHQPGGIGPMQLTSYEKIKGFAPMIRETVRTQRMPPYHADPHVGTFSDDKRLSAEQIKTLVHWIEAGAPRGAGEDPLAKVKFEAPEWPLGKPDLVLDIPSYKIPASGIVDYQRPYAANPLTEGRWVRASTIAVNERQAVHHILTGYMTQVPTGGQANESRWGASMGGYAVGSESTIWPSNIGTYLPAGGAIGFQNHYTPFGKEVVDKSKIALYFYPKDQMPELMMRNGVIADQSIQIPPGVERHREVAYLTFPKEALLYSAFPHAHYRGGAAQVEMILPDGSKKLLLALAKYDFNWQREYTFAQPIKVPAGAKLVATITYDNSTRNPANPDAKRTVPWGDQSFDEMLYTAIRYRWVDETAKNQLPQYDAMLNQSRLLGMLDDNIDGKLQQAELKGSAAAQLKGAFALLDANKDGSLDQAELANAQAMMQGRGRQGSN